MQAHEKIRPIEGIRGWACFVVLLSHLSLTFYPYLHALSGQADPQTHPIQYFIHHAPLGFLYSGTAAVYVFFTLSGFILAKIALKHNASPSSIVVMGLKRYPRLMIPAVASCLLAYALFCLPYVKSPLLTSWINGYGGGKDYSVIGALYSGAIDVFFLGGASHYNPVLWTMRVELIGSLIVYALCLNRQYVKIPYFTPALILICLVATALRKVDFTLGLSLTSFIGGYLLSIYGGRISKASALATLLVGFYLAGAHDTSASYEIPKMLLGAHTYTLCNYLSGFLIVYAVVSNDRLGDIFSGRVALMMGKLSFSVYLLHMPMIATFGKYVFNMIFGVIGAYDVAAILSSALTTALVYGSAMLFYQYIDLKGMIVSNKISLFITASFNAASRGSRAQN